MPIPNSMAVALVYRANFPEDKLPYPMSAVPIDHVQETERGLAFLDKPVDDSESRVVVAATWSNIAFIEYTYEKVEEDGS